jgi:hypothetical protein
MLKTLRTLALVAASSLLALIATGCARPIFELRAGLVENDYQER